MMTSFDFLAQHAFDLAMSGFLVGALAFVLVQSLVGLVFRRWFGGLWARIEAADSLPISHRSWLANRGYIPHLQTAAERRFCETARIAIMAPTWIAVASFLTVAAVVMMDQLGWVDVL